MALTEDGGAVAIAENLVIRDRGAANLSSATIALINPLDASQERLAVDVAGTQLTANYEPANGQLQVTGMGSRESYQTVLRSVTYDNSSQDPHPASRSIKVVVRDERTAGRAAIATLNVQPLNDPPKLLPIANQDAAINQALTIMISATDPEASDIVTFQLDYDDSPESATIEPIDGVPRWFNGLRRKMIYLDRPCSAFWQSTMARRRLSMLRTSQYRWFQMAFPAAVLDCRVVSEIDDCNQEFSSSIRFLAHVEGRSTFLWSRHELSIPRCRLSGQRRLR